MTAAWPPLDPRRRRELRAELQARARAVLPGAEPAAGADDWLGAMLDIAARLEAEVTRRLDRVPEKQQRNFADWLGVRPRAARAARLAAVFRSALGASALTAPAGVRLQAATALGQATFETEDDVTILPGALKALAAVAGDRIMLPPPGLYDPAAAPPQPVRRTLLSLAAAGGDQLQVAPALGLVAGGLIRVGGKEYAIVEVKGDLVRIQPPLEAEAAKDAEVVEVTAFAPAFSDAAAAAGPRDWQAHELYLGDDEILNIAAAASIQVVSDPPLTDVAWAYWGKAKGEETPQWRTLAAPPATPDTLAKAVGSIEPLERGGAKTRWLRATSGAGKTLRMQNVQLAVTSDAVAGFEAIANAAPISSTYDFYPLGAEPRLFDSFYLGCAEAFSKTGADVTVHIEVPTATLGALAAAPVTAGQDALFFAIGRDGLLYRVTQPAAGGGLAWSNLARPKTAAVRLSSAGAPGVAVYQGGPAVAAPVEGSGEIWLWRGPADEWSSLGEAAADPPPGQPTKQVMLRVEGADLRAVALRDGRLFEALVLTNGQPPAQVQWAEIDLGGEAADELVGYWSDALPAAGGGAQPGPMTVVRVAGKLLVVAGNPLAVAAARTELQLAIFDLAGASAINIGGTPMFAGLSTDNHLVAFTDPAAPWDADLGANALLGAVSLVQPAAGGDPLVLLVAETPGGRSLGVWQPKADGPITFLPIPEGAHHAGQGPIPIGPAPGPLLPPSIVLVGAQADLARLDMTAAGLTVSPALMSDAIALDPPANWDLLELTEGGHTAYFDPGAGHAFGSVLVLDRPAGFGSGAVTWRTFDRLGAGTGLIVIDPVPHPPPPKLLPDPALLLAGVVPRRDDIIDAQGAKRRVTRNVTVAAPNAEMVPDLGGSDADPAPYTQFRESDHGAARTQPLIDLSADPVRAQAALEAGVLYAAGADPPFQAVVGDGSGHLLLSDAWITAPVASGGQIAFQTTPSAVTADWQGYEVPANPALSWEYWNGTGWWGLTVADATGNLRRTADVVFEVPGDLQPTDVIGKVNHWIRARLVGGDYGHESFTLVTTPGTGGASTQNIERNTDGVRPPRVLELTIKYKGPPVTPRYLLTYDNLGWRDQSDANRSPGTVMQVFQTFEDSLAAAVAPPADATAADDPCACREPAPPAAADAAAPPVGPAPGALYVGLDTPVLPGSVRLLWNIDDQALLRGLEVQALRDGVFADVGFADATDGLAQSGVLTLALERPTTPAVLFGQTLHWLRIRPTKDAAPDWAPRVRGLFLNAVWAAASESQEPEVLGSSDGAPLQVVTLARRPVLPRSLELRVRETLDEEQIAELLAPDPRAVVIDPVGFRPGPWVLWREVADPLDEPAGARVYALDEATGEVRFGDALHGRPPPVGVDNIAAFAYRRGGGAAANGVKAGQPLQLVSPLTGVEKVVAGAASAGGADVATAEVTVERAAPQLWSRDRAVSLRDIEDLALASGPDVVQARCETLRSGGVRAVVVVNAADPRPGRRACGELAAYLASRAGPGLRGGLRVEAPVLRPLALDLELVVADLGHTGAVAAAVGAALRDLLDPVSGGLDGRGWPLGAAPSDADLAASLVETVGVLSVGEIRRLTPEAEAFPDRLPMRALATLSTEDLAFRWQVDA